MTRQRADYSELDDDLLGYASRLEQNKKVYANEICTWEGYAVVPIASMEDLKQLKELPSRKYEVLKYGKNYAILWVSYTARGADKQCLREWLANALMIEQCDVALNANNPFNPTEEQA